MEMKVDDEWTETFKNYYYLHEPTNDIWQYKMRRKHNFIVRKNPSAIWCILFEFVISFATGAMGFIEKPIFFFRNFHV